MNTSGWQTRSEKEQIQMQALGGGLKPGDFVLMAERNWRRVTAIPGADLSAAAASWETPAAMTWPSSEISEYTAAYAGVTGVMPGVVVETLHDPSTDGIRRSIFLDLHPIPWIQLEIWRRYESGTRRLADTLGVAHLYFDF